MTLMRSPRFLCAAAAGALALGLLAGIGAAAGAPASPPKDISTLDAAILGFIQGLTEYLPVSSTGHLILANYWLDLTPAVDPAHKLTGGFVKNEAVDAYDIVLHAGTFLAVLGLYRRRVGQMVRGVAGKDGAGLRLLAALVVAFLPAAAVGYKFKHRIEEELFNPLTVAAALAVGGVLMIAVEQYWRRWRKGAVRVTQVDQTRLWQALVIGSAQCLALWPGTSRSMITILAGLIVGLDLVTAAEFSFLVALPTLGAATLYTGYKNWGELTQHVGWPAMVVGLVVTTAVAVLAVRGFLHWLTKHGLLPFGIYRIALAAVVYASFAL